VEVPWSTIAATAAATAPWLLAVGVVYLRRRPARPEPGPPTLDLGPEPPAVANFLVHGFRGTRDAVPATLIDLAARRLVEIEEREPGAYVCRLEKAPDGGLTSYERRVLDLLRSRATGDIVPAGALTTGPEEESKRWWKGFEKEVVTDAQRRGLCVDLLDKRTFLWLSGAAIAPAAVLGILAGGRVGFGYWVAAFLFLGWVMGLNTQRETPEGLAAAARWLGVRAKLAEDEAFQTQAPIAVALWERHLAYGAAFGLATAAVGALPMGTESAHHAWSPYGGQWRSVRIHYPWLVPLGWGLHPLVVVLRAGLALAPALVLWLVVPKELVVVPVAVVAGAGLVVVWALVDLGSTREITGQVLRLRAYGSDDDKRYYVAVDDGTSATIRAWRVRSELYSPLRQYEVVTGTLTRNLRYVRAISETESELSAAKVATAPRV
jgi:Predicted membrane protein (DUF2207) C-terminal domain